ncbi:hypothetical protein ACH5RR_008917 [Cinchona calisaya]|uniref:Uncharacterized protein n=1 Tax=Cinchona calisaya TaxID=153742 RepID=A0ABD3ACP2_9GENT
MLKSVAMALPTYTMSTFRLSKKLCKEMSRMMANFWWSSPEKEKAMHWMAWNKMTDAKRRVEWDLEIYITSNTALLAKQLSRLITSPNLLVSKVLKAKYWYKDDIFKTKVPNSASWIWQSIMSVREFLGRGIRKRVGNGETINIWEDRWIPNNEDGRLKTKMPDNCQGKVGNQLIRNFRWNKELIFQTFCREDAENILCIPISLAGRNDKLFWKYSANGHYTIQSGYWRAKEEQKLSQQRPP